METPLMENARMLKEALDNGVHAEAEGKESVRG